MVGSHFRPVAGSSHSDTCSLRVELGDDDEADGDGDDSDDGDGNDDINVRWLYQAGNGNDNKYISSRCILASVSVLACFSALARDLFVTHFQELWENSSKILNGTFRFVRRKYMWFSPLVRCYPNQIGGTSALWVQQSPVVQCALHCASFSFSPMP